jgi:hypothetical protein
MVDVHKQHAALGRGSFQWVEVGTKSVAAYRRQFGRQPAGESLLILNNLDKAAQEVTIPKPDRGVFRDLISREEIRLGRTALLPPYSHLCLRKKAVTLPRKSLISAIYEYLQKRAGLTKPSSEEGIPGIHPIEPQQEAIGFFFDLGEPGGQWLKPIQPQRSPSTRRDKKKIRCDPCNLGGQARQRCRHSTLQGRKSHTAGCPPAAVIVA